MTVTDLLEKLPLALTSSEDLLPSERRQVLADAAQWVAEPWFANRLGTLAFELMKSQQYPAAIAAFDVLMEAATPLELTHYCNALWLAQRDNTGLEPDPERSKRWLAHCLPHGPQNPAIFFNAACVQMEAGARAAVLDLLGKALEHGYGNAAAMFEEKLFAPLAQDAQFRKLKADAKKSRAVAVDPEGFDALLARPGLVFVDFWAAWCGPCRGFAPVYEGVARKTPGVTFAKVDTEAHEELSGRFDIQSIPTLMAFRDGLLVHRSSGAMPEPALQALVASLVKLDGPTAKAREEARQRTAKGLRPKGVPAQASWVPEDKEWAAGERDDEDRHHGLWKYWRDDGTQCAETTLEHGVPHGPFRRFHETGEVSQTGQYARGKLHGTRTWLASEGFTTELMHRTPEGYISLKVRRTEMDYDQDRVLVIRHFDAAGTPLAPMTGEPLPKRPKELPAAVEYRADLFRWVQPSIDAQRNRHGTWREWAVDGEFLLSCTYEHGARHGPCEARARGRTPVAGAVRERGGYDREQPAGVWDLLDASGKVLLSRDLGEPLHDDGLGDAKVLVEALRPSDDWRALAQACRQSGRIAESLLAEARAAARSADATELLDALASSVLPRTRQAAEQLASDATRSAGDEEPSPAGMANALLLGADPAEVLRGLALFCEEERPLVALDLIQAAILVAPKRAALGFHRALILLSLGLPDQAREDARALRENEEEAGRGEFLDHYVKALFPTFGPWPQQESLQEEEGPEPQQELPAIREVAQKYATRLTLIREAMQQRFAPDAQPKWIPPAVTSLLPKGPVELESGSFDDDEGNEVEVDESLDAHSLPLPSLLRAARADWSALTWLLWAAGAKGMVLPARLAPPKEFGAGANLVLSRLSRCSGGEESQAPSFEWEGADLDSYPPAVRGVAQQQYLETKAMFHWLVDGSNRSPWQDNLRGGRG